MKLQVSGITKYYGKQLALKNFSADFSSGIFGILGPNGAGKTTLINIILQIIPATTGKIFLDDKDILAMGDDYFKNVGYMPQYPKFYKTFSAREFLDYICTIKNIPKKNIKDRIDEALNLVNLYDRGKTKIGGFSGGMRQRLGIAQAIINDPAILILDEPTAGLDPKERIRFRNIISKLSKDKIVLLATHIVSDIEYIANKVLILDRGHLVSNDDIPNLLSLVSDKVWYLEVGNSEVDKLIENYSVGNVQPIKNGYSLKIISDVKPVDEAIIIEPVLEDVFLYFFDAHSKINSHRAMPDKG